MLLKPISNQCLYKNFVGSFPQVDRKVPQDRSRILFQFCNSVNLVTEIAQEGFII